MSDLLSAWVLSSGSTTDMDGTGLSTALEQARLSYHAQEVRKMAMDPGSASTIKEPVEYTPAPSSKGSIKKIKRKPPPGSRKGTSHSQADSGMMSASNSTATDNSDKKYLDVERFDNSETSSERSRSSSRTKRSKEEISERNSEASSVMKVDTADIDKYDEYGSDENILSETIKLPNYEESENQSSQRKGSPKKSKKSKLPKIGVKDNTDKSSQDDTQKKVKPKSPKKLPNLSPSKMPRYPNIQKQDIEDDQNGKNDTSLLDNKNETRKKGKKLEKRNTSLGLIEKAIKNKVEESFKKKEEDDGIDSIEPRRSKKKPKNKKVLKDDEEEDIHSISASVEESLTEDISESSKKNHQGKNIKPPSKIKTIKIPEKDKSSQRSPMKQKARSVSPKKQRNKSPDENERNDSPVKSRRKQKDKSVSELNLAKDDTERNNTSPRKTKKMQKDKSVSEPNLAENDTKEKRNIKSPQKKKKLTKQESKKDPDKKNISDEENAESDTESNVTNGRATSPKKKKIDLVFSDEEEESPYGVSKGRSRGGQYLRRTTYLDILMIEKERRESIRKIKEEKEKNGAKQDDTFTRDKLGNKVYASAKSKSKKEEASASKEPPPDNIDIAIKEIVEKALIISSGANYDRNRDSLISMIKRKIKEDNFIKSLCQTDEWFMKNIISVMVTFGPLMKIHTKTQAMVWIFLNRLAFFWSKNGKSPPSEKDLMNDPETMSFASELSKLCFNLLTSDQVVATAVVDVEPEMDSSSISLSFEQYDVIIPKQRLENFDLAILTERGPYTDDVGNFMECSFVDKPMLEFLSCIHIHANEEDLNDISKTKSIRMLPLVCGISSRDKGEGQKIVSKFIKEVGTESSDRNAEFYLKYLHGMFLESPITFLHCIHETRMKKVHLLPPPNEKQIYIVQTKMAIHDIVALTYYLENYDRSRINPEALVIQDCGLNDDALHVFGKRLWAVKTVKITGSNFTQKGIHEVTRRLTGEGDVAKVDVLDLSDCQLDDESLIRLVPIFGHVSELYLSDNSFTWYGVKKLAAVQRRSKKLSKLDMSRCQLSQNGFFELIPVLLKTEHVILQGNHISPIELKIFSSQIRESKGGVVLKTLDISSSNLTDESLQQIAKLAFLVENIDLHNSSFGPDGVTMLVKCFHKFEGGVLKTLNLRMCKLTDQCLSILSEIIPYLNSVVLSSNNFGGSAGLKALAESIDTAEKRKLKHIDLRHSRVGQEMKKVVNEVCRRHKIDLKIW